MKVYLLSVNVRDITYRHQSTNFSNLLIWKNSHTHTHVYICVYVCVCVCVFM